MTDNNIQAPIPLKNKTVTQLKNLESSRKRPLSSSGGASVKRNLTSPVQQLTELRARSITPTLLAEKLLNGLSSEDIINRRLKYYNLDYPEDEETYYNVVFEKSSKWFSRDVKPDFQPERHLPYKTETPREQARYLCHVLVNLHIAISSLDIQGLLSITSKDLSELQNEIDDLALNTDLFRLSNEVDTDVIELHDGDKLEDLDVPEAGETGKITAKSSSIINVNHWTNELRNCLSFDVPLTVRKSLTVVYYYLSLVKGQDTMREMHVEMFERLVDPDMEGTNFTELLRESGLILDHKVLFDFIIQFLPYPDSDYVRYDLSSKEDLQLFRLLLKLAHMSRPFFDDTDQSILTDSMEYILSNMSPSTTATILPFLTSFVPLHFHKDAKITDYFPFCFSLWSFVIANVAVDTHLYDFVGEVSEDVHRRLMNSKKDTIENLVTFGKFGIFSSDQITFLFNRIQGHLRSNGQIHSYTRTVKPLVYALNGSNNELYFEKLKDLVQSLDTFVHPSNQGFWTKTIAKFIHSFIKMYHGRKLEEEEAQKNGLQSKIFLTPDCTSRIVKLFLNLILIGVQNKSNDVANYYIACLTYLLDLSPSNSYLIFDKILVEVYDTLAGEYINSRHRVISSLKQFTRAIRFMVSQKLYRIHITNILSMLIDKIDLNDAVLTSNVFNSIVTIATFVPFTNLITDGEYLTFESTTIPFIQEHFAYLKMGNTSNDFPTDSKVLESAFRASTTLFQNIIKIYVDKLFPFVDVELDGELITKMNQTTYLIQEAMDDKMFSYYSDIFQRRFWDNDVFKEKEPNYELVTMPLAAIVRRDNSISSTLVKTLIYNVKEQIKSCLLYTSRCV